VPRGRAEQSAAPGAPPNPHQHSQTTIKETIVCYYTTTICKDGDRHQVVTHWDDHDPNRFIYAPVTVTGEMTEQKLADAVASQGFRIVSNGSDNIGRGWAIVKRPDHRFYDPISGDWYSFLSNEQKDAITAKYPGADVPGTHYRHPTL
jgi:hypothetical protein